MRLSHEPSGLELFGEELNPSVLDELLGWRAHPELRRILENLRSHTDRKAFFDTFAEAMVARHLLRHGCSLRFEVPTPLGRRCDFEVVAGEQKFYLHVKRLNTERPPHKMLAISSRLRVLERIARPYIVQVRWHENLTDDQMQQLVTQAEAFIIHAHVGDEMKARDHGGRELGGVRIIAPWEGPQVSLTIGLPSGFIDQAPRFRRLMHRAYQQFMPKAVNVVLMCSGAPDEEADVENALLGSHIERWDAFPPRGKRIAHGRATDGFWHGQRFSESRYAGWLWFPPHADRVHSRLWVRRELPLDEAMTATLRRIFTDPAG